MTEGRGCLACGRAASSPVLSLGSTPLANAFLDPEALPEFEASYPLEWVFCEGCSLVQLSEVVSPEILFSNYIYVSGTSTTMARHHRELAAMHVRELGLGREDLVFDIASNDGSLLSCFREHGVRVLGVEPAKNLTDMARRVGIPTENRFFSSQAARELRKEFGPAALVCANNVMAHVPDLSGFLDGLRRLVEPSGLVSVEVPYLGCLLDQLEYDTIYHEHLSYFSVLAVGEAFRRAGLGLCDVRRIPIHGGSLRLLARANEAHGAAARELMADERARGFDRPETYKEFAHEVDANRAALRATLEDHAERGHRVAAYGAPAKGNTLLNACGIGPSLVAYTVDRNPLKVGLLCPGSRIPVRPREALEQDQPDLVLILPWNIAEEIVAQEAAFRAKGGRFFVPIPVPRILS